MCATFVSVLFIFCTRMFPAKSETREPGGIIVECTTYETSDGTNILLEHNNTIYVGYMMEDFLENPLKSEDNGIILTSVTRSITLMTLVPIILLSHMIK